MTDETKLLPCPFCGGTTPKMTYYGFQTISQIECEICGAEGPPAEHDDLAIAAWNRRA